MKNLIKANSMDLNGPSNAPSGKKWMPLLCFWIFGIALVFPFSLQSQTTTISEGSFIINMGVTPQTVGNGLKPYGLVYELVTQNNVVLIWSIEPTKAKDGIDFSHNGIDYRGGTFVIPAEYRNPTVDAVIASWQAQGVVGATTVSEITIPQFTLIDVATAPRWTMDKKNGKIAAGYFVNAGIPPSAYGGPSSNWKDPAELDCCDDLFVMPHADPEWVTHARLVSWNAAITEPDGCKGAIWAACHAPSALENMVDNITPDRSVQANFLTVKDPAWTGTSGKWTLSNSLILWGSHNDGSPPYTFNPTMAADPVGQWMGIIDAATQNGSEQIYIPRQGIVANASTYSPDAVARWRPGTNILVYDPTQSNVTNPNLSTLQNVAAVVVYGRAYDDPDRGFVMYEAGHSHNKSTGPANIAAQRAFFNFGILVANEKIFQPNISSLPAIVGTGSSTPLEISVNPGGAYTTTWSSTCGGSFFPNNEISIGNPITTTFTAPFVDELTPCNILITIEDECGRVLNQNHALVIQSCELIIDKTITNVSCNGFSDGQIAMNITGSDGPFNWNWSRVSPAETGSGTGNTVTGLSAGTYHVTVDDGVACEGTFTQLITEPILLTATPNVTNYLCFGQTGAINLSVAGGTGLYSYSWEGPNGFVATTKDISDLLQGQYNVTVTDENSCTATASATVSGPAALLEVGLDAKTDVTCNGAGDGTINITASGGTPAYTYEWSDGSIDEDRTGLAPGTYIVTVTDDNGCTATLTATITQPAVLNISVNKTDPTCPPGADPPVNNDGAIDVTVTGGTGPYSYFWSTLDGTGLIATDQNQTGLTAGTYSLEVTDDNGCIATASVTLTEENPFPPIPGGIE